MNGTGRVADRWSFLQASTPPRRPSRDRRPSNSQSPRRRRDPLHRPPYDCASYRVRGVGGSCAEHLTVESYTIIISLQSYFYYLYSITHSLFHSRLKSFIFCKSSLPQPFLFLLRDSLYGFPRLFTPTSEHIRLFTF